MSTAVQTSYRPTIAPAVEGMIADTSENQVGTWLCETSAGIAFGRAVSQGSRDKGCILGGSAFFGVSVRDITLVLSPVSPTDGYDTAQPLDKYGLNVNAAILSRGHIWVRPQANVVAGGAVYYDTTTGIFGGSASGMAASGSIKFSAQPAADTTLVLNGKTVTFKLSGASGLQVNIGPTLGDTIHALATMLNASNDTDIDDLVYAAYPPSPGGGWGADTLLMSEKVVGTAGNSITITAGTSGATASGATLAGGTAAATLVSAARWHTSAQAGQLAVLSLGIQA